MPTVYRIKHLPSGMYFCPSRKARVKLLDDSEVYQDLIPRYIPSNLSKDGKAYTRRPSLKQILGTHYYTHHLVNSVEDLDHGMIGEYKMLEVMLDEWIIEEVT
jgi:hypothetical protein